MEDPASSACRAAAFQWLRERLDIEGDRFTRESLEKGFPFQGQQVHLVSPQGIFKPKQIRDYPLSITTVSDGPYQDTLAPDKIHLLYRYRGTNPEHLDNRRLRAALRDRIPLIYFHSVVPGRYQAIWPVFVVHDEPTQLTFTVAVDDYLQLNRDSDDADEEIRREYITRQARTRLHQSIFRDRVLLAYREQCTVCRLRHVNLLDAAHIVADSDPEGEPVVNNGLSLCKLHHAAYDSSFFAIRPDYRIEVRTDIMEERDGPMLLHGLQEINEERIELPAKMRDRPDPARLEVRYEEFHNQ